MIGIVIAAHGHLAQELANTAKQIVGELPHVASISVEPAVLTMPLNGSQQLKVTAHYTDGSKRDVTDLALFQTNNPSVAKISATGLVSAGGRGDTFVFARFNRFTIGSEVIVLPQDKNYAWTHPPDFTRTPAVSNEPASGGR